MQIWAENDITFCDAIHIHTCTVYTMLQCHGPCVIKTSISMGCTQHIASVFTSHFDNLTYTVCKIYIIFLFTSLCWYEQFSLSSTTSYWTHDQYTLLHQKPAYNVSCCLFKKSWILNRAEVTLTFPPKKSCKVNAVLCSLEIWDCTQSVDEQPTS